MSESEYDSSDLSEGEERSKDFFLDEKSEKPGKNSSKTCYMLNPAGKSDRDKGFFDDPDDEKGLSQILTVKRKHSSILFITG